MRDAPPYKSPLTLQFTTAGELNAARLIVPLIVRLSAAYERSRDDATGTIRCAPAFLRISCRHDVARRRDACHGHVELTPCTRVQAVPPPPAPLKVSTSTIKENVSSQLARSFHASQIMIGTGQSVYSKSSQTGQSRFTKLLGARVRCRDN